MSWSIELWDDLEAAGGARKAMLHAPSGGSLLLQGSLTLALDNTDNATLLVERSTDWLPHAQLRRGVIRFDDGSSGVVEHRLSQIQQHRGRGEGTVQLRTVSPLVDHAIAGLIRDLSTGGQTWTNLGGIGLTPAQYLESFAIPELHRHGSSFVAVGTVDPTDPLDIAWDRWTPGQLEQELEQRTESELEYVRDGSTGYDLNLRSERGSSASEVYLRVGRNLSVVAWKQQIEHLKTVLVPAGAVVQGAVEAAGIQQTLWKVTAATTDSVTVADPAIMPADPPVQVNDQLTDLYVLKPDATLTQITSASTSQVLKLDDASGLSIGDYVSFRASSAGVHMIELVNPAQAASSAYGRVVGTYEDSQLRGEANYVRNGLFATFVASSSTRVLGAQANAASTGTHSISIKGLPPSVAITEGDCLHRVRTRSEVNSFRVMSSVVASTAGVATINLSTRQGIGYDFDLNEKLYLSQQGGDRRFTGWDATNSTAPSGYLFIQARTASLAGTLSGTFNGAVNTNGSTKSPNVNLTGLGAFDEIGAGDVLSSTAGSFRIMGSVVASSDGEATVAIHGNLTAADGVAFTINRPTLTQDGAPNFAVLITQDADFFIDEQTLFGPSYTVRYDSTLPLLHLRVGVSYHALAGADLTSSSTSLTPLRVQLWDVSSSGAIDTVTDEDRLFAADEVQEAEIGITAELSSDTIVQPRIRPPLNEGSVTVDPNPFVFVRWVSMTLGPDPRVPPVEGSWANQLWQRANKKLLELSQDPDVFEVELTDLSQVEGYVADDERLVLGGTVRLHDEELGIDKELRIVQLTYDLIRPERVRVVLAKRPSLLTDALATARTQTRVAVSIDVAGTTSTGGTAGAGTGTPVSSDPVTRTGVSTITLSSPNEQPSKQPGAFRAVAPTSGGSTGNVPRRVFKEGFE